MRAPEHGSHSHWVACISVLFCCKYNYKQDQLPFQILEAYRVIRNALLAPKMMRLEDIGLSNGDGTGKLDL